MALTPGSRIGVFQLVELIGRGGMGEVYRATDTKLKRQVAIKILPPSFAADHDRLARFQREAEVLASLNHPNIAAIYGLEESEGITALVMELVEGDDLSQRIARGAIPHDEALPIAKQIAEALEAAHEQGIIHRDLKPANIKVRADGTVKVLDFGLAKAMEPTGGMSLGMSQAPTITTPALMTGAGMILGTAAYMSPEQARGKTVDKRADIWAFGCVLFEMLAGQRAFGGEDLTVTLARVVERDPDFDALPASVTPRVRQALRVCLRKDLKQRASDIRDVHLALDGAFETTTPRAADTSSATPRARLAWSAFAVAAVFAAALAIPALQHLRETPLLAPSELRTEINTPASESPEEFALSPDGERIVYVATVDGVSRLWLRSLAATTAQPLGGTEDASAPFWSPDGRSIGFFAAGALKRLDLDRGAPQTLAPARNGFGGAWNADDVILFAPTPAGGLMRVPAEGGASEPVTAPGEQQVGHSYPEFLPDGRRFLYYVSGRSDAAGVYLAALDGGAATRLTPADASGVYHPAGWLLWVLEGRLLGQRFDATNATLSGDPVVLADGATGGSGRGPMSVARSGLVAYRTGIANQNQLTWFDRSGMKVGVVGTPDAFLREPRVSPDNRRVVVARDVQGNQDLWLLDGTRESRLTFDAGAERNPVWSPDGTRIAYRSAVDLYQRATTGTEASERIVASDQLKVPTHWSADGRFLLYHSLDPRTEADLWVMPTEGSRTPFVWLKTPSRESSGTFSPDGRWVAYMSNESRRLEIYVRPFVEGGSRSANAGGQQQVSTSGGTHPAWRRDGRELYYLSPEGAMMAVPIAFTGSAMEPGIPVELFRTRVVGGGIEAAQRHYDVAGDGRFLIDTIVDAPPSPITLLQHWNPEVKQ